MMYWEYTFFEMKRILYNRRNWFLGLFLLLFFPILFITYSQSEPVSLEDEKRVEAAMIDTILNMYPEPDTQTAKEKEVYDILLEQSSLINYQIYYFWMGDPAEDYVKDGLALNELRLQVHDLGNESIPSWGVIPKHEILKENALLHYVEAHDLPIQTETLAASDYIVFALQTMSGLLFYFFVLLAGSEVLVSERQHITVINGFPLSFMKKIASKISIYFICTITFLVLGLLIGGYTSYKKAGIGDFNYPVLLYKNGDFEAISTSHYLLYMLLGIALVTVIVLYLSVLLNMIFKNAYANILIGLGLFLLPFLLQSVGVETLFFQSIKYADISKVLSGDMAMELGNSQIDYWHAITRLVGWLLTIVGVIYAVNKFSYIVKNGKEMREKDA